MTAADIVENRRREEKKTFLSSRRRRQRMQKKIESRDLSNSRLTSRRRRDSASAFDWQWKHFYWGKLVVGACMKCRFSSPENNLINLSHESVVKVSPSSTPAVEILKKVKATNHLIVAEKKNPFR